MKKHLLLLTASILCLGFVPAFAQMGGPPTGPKFDGALAKVFGDNTAFTAALESQITPKSGETITMPGKIFFDAGKSRIEINLSDAKGLPMPPGAVEQMKSMGLDQIITISLPEKKSVYMAFPGLQSYAETPLPNAVAGTNQDFTVKTTELGKDTVNGHPCVQNKVIVTDAKGVAKEFTVWNATDLKNFPVRIVLAEPDAGITMNFSNIVLAKPAATTFDLPKGYTHYDNMQTMMQTEMMKKMTGGMGLPGH